MTFDAVITGNSAIWLNFLAVAVISFAVANMVVSILSNLFNQKFLQLEVSARKRSLWLLVSMPWLVSAVIGVCFIYPLTEQIAEYSPFTPSMSQSNSGLAHWHHLDSFYLLSWHGVTLLAAVTLLLYQVGKKLIGLYQHKQQLASLHRLATPIKQPVYELDAIEASAFSCGFRKPKCYITSGMLTQTNSQEQEIIIKHELAHIAKLDPLKKWLFSLLAAFYLPGIAARLKLHMTLAMEQAADEAVIDDKINSVLIASTLVKVAKLNANAKTNAKPGFQQVLSQDLVANFGADVLEQRVYFLLGQLQLKPVNHWLTLLFSSLILLICASSLDGIHHAIETIFSH